MYFGNNHIIGTIGLRPVANTKNICGEIRRLYIHPDWQNKGIGSELIDFVINFAKSKSYEKLRATTSFDRTVIIYLLQKKAFIKYKNIVKLCRFIFEDRVKPKYQELYNDLSHSISEGEKYFKNTLILNPVENVPEIEVIKPCTSYLHGLYNTDSIRNSKEKINTKIQFSGRDTISSDVNRIYQEMGKFAGR